MSEIIAPDGYWIVDTNIIIAYQNEEDERLTSFINNPQNKFFYTETVRKELSSRPNPPDIFRFIDSKLSETKKEIYYDLLSKDVQLTHEQKVRFRNDIYIIFEASYVQGDVTENTFKLAKLLTSNLKLLKKFLSTPQLRDRVEEIINIGGMEHLIDIAKPADIFIG